MLKAERKTSSLSNDTMLMDNSSLTIQANQYPVEEDDGGVEILHQEHPLETEK